MRLRVVGCSGSFPGPDSPASCYLLTANDGERDWRILLDLGSGSLGAVQKYLDVGQIDALFLTHLHPDHCMDLCGLHVAVRWCPAGWDGRRIPVYSPVATADHLADAYGLDRDPGMREEFDFRGYRQGRAIELGPFSVTAISVNHPMEEAYALRVEVTERCAGAAARRRVLTYSGDTDSCAGLNRAAANADLFLCEAAFQEGRDDAVRNVHLTGRRAGEAAQAAGARSLLLTHLPVWTDPDVVLAEAHETYQGPIEVVKPDAEYPI